MKFDTAQIAKFNNYLSDELGIHFSSLREGEMFSKLNEFLISNNYANVDSCISDLEKSSFGDRLFNQLIANVTIGETYFFRDLDFFDILRNDVLPKIITKRQSSDRRIRILSAGCSSGEELYSIAMLLHEIIPDINSWNIVLHGIDINSEYINKAKDAVYSKWSFRNKNEENIAKHFIRKENEYELKPEIKELVCFSQINLLSENFPSLLTNTTAFDIVVCKNVLMYFKAEIVRQIVDKIKRSMLYGAYLFVAAAETSLINDQDFITVSGKSYYFQKKDPASEIQSGKAPPRKKTMVFPKTTSLNRRKISKKIPDNEKLISVIEEDIEKGNYPGALKTRKLLIENGYDKPEIYKQGIIAYTNLGESNKAYQLCEEYMKKYKLLPEPYILKCLLEIESGNIPEALSLIDKSIYLDDELFINYYLKGKLLGELGEQKKSDEAYRIARKILVNLKENEEIPYTDHTPKNRLLEILEMKIERREMNK